VTGGKLYSEHARYQHQFWKILSNADANPNWPARRPKFHTKTGKMEKISARRGWLRENFTHGA
jgi:hypothetical protein